MDNRAIFRWYFSNSQSFNSIFLNSTHLPHPSPHLRRCICFVSASGLRRAHTDAGAPLQRLLARGRGGALRGRARPRREAHLPAIRSCVVAVKVRAVGAGSRVSEHPREACSLTAELMLPPTRGGGARGSSAHAQGGAHAPAHRRGQSSRLKGKFD